MTIEEIIQEKKKQFIEKYGYKPNAIFVSPDNYTKLSLLGSEIKTENVFSIKEFEVFIEKNMDDDEVIIFNTKDFIL